MQHREVNTGSWLLIVSFLAFRGTLKLNRNQQKLSFKMSWISEQQNVVPHLPLTFIKLRSIWGWIWGEREAFGSLCVFMVKWRDSFSVHSTPDALRSALTSELLTQAAGQKRAALRGAAVVPEDKSLQRGSNRCSQLISLSHSSLHLSMKLCAHHSLKIQRFPSVIANYQNCIWTFTPP